MIAYTTGTSSIAKTIVIARNLVRPKGLPYTNQTKFVSRVDSCITGWSIHWECPWTVVSQDNPYIESVKCQPSSIESPHNRCFRCLSGLGFVSTTVVQTCTICYDMLWDVVQMRTIWNVKDWSSWTCLWCIVPASGSTERFVRLS